MFTGIVKAVGRLERIEIRGGDRRLTITSPDLSWSEYEIGESISVNGVCLTAVDLMDNGFVADVSVETMNVTALNGLSTGGDVNLEPAISLGERLGGHLVSGHVDCVGIVKSRKNDARSVRLGITIPADHQRYVAKKGSICIDGVSLTVNAVSDGQIGVSIIPHTASATIIGSYRVGTEVNIEVDLIARYLERLLTDDISGSDAAAEITSDFLRANGYV